MIGIDPHKSSHTAVAIGAAEERLGELQVRACPSQAGQLLAWAAAWPERTWAVEGAAGLGHLLAQQLVAAGEQVLDVPPKLAARVRLLQAGDTTKNDPSDARPVAVAALRSTAQRPVLAEDHTAVLKARARRHRDLGRARDQAACRLHAVLCDLVPGGVRKEISAGQAARILERVTPSGAVARARCELAAGILAGIRRLDAQLRDTSKKLAAAVKASGTSLTGIFGAGPVIAGTVIGDVRHVSRFPGRDHFAAYNGTAPAEVSSGGSTTPPTWPRSLSSATGTAPAAPATTRNSPRARRTRTRPAASSARSATPSTPRWQPTPGRPRPPAPTAREGNRGTTLSPRRPAHTPSAGSSDKPPPGLPQPYDPAPPHVPPRSSRTEPLSAGLRTPQPPRRNPGQPLDTNNKEDSICTISTLRSPIISGAQKDSSVQRRSYGGCSRRSSPHDALVCVSVARRRPASLRTADHEPIAYAPASAADRMRQSRTAQCAGPVPAGSTGAMP